MQVVLWFSGLGGIHAVSHLHSGGVRHTSHGEEKGPDIHCLQMYQQFLVVNEGTFFGFRLSGLDNFWL